MPNGFDCLTPGMKIRSGGRGRGLARGRGRGPIGTPFGGECGTGVGPGGTDVCLTPGERIRSGGRGRGLAMGGGRGPIGTPRGRIPGRGFTASLYSRLFGG